ncbi:MAG: [protein-PII] uridylyltransferase [Deltaproteobacteria bacterium]|nr:[protein-PII] uridylyltransferase [Deltaproteobacteria bacterium]
MTDPPSIDVYFGDENSTARRGEAGVVSAARAYLAAGREHLQNLHSSGALGHRVNETYSNLIDRLVRRLFRLAEEDYFSDGREIPAVLTVIAVGGYGRRELNIHSDVDLLFLYQSPLSGHVKVVAERVQYWLWDASLSVGSATRTIEETIELAEEDQTVRTSILTSRCLAGSGVLFHQFVERLRSGFIADSGTFVSSQLTALRERHRQQGDSLYLLQPNIKEGAGGLRDYHAAYWALQATQPGGGRIDDFLHVGLLTEEESREYLAALDFLWRVRNEAHLITDQKRDQLSFELQEKIADSLGYANKDVSEGDVQLPVECFMGDYYRHARAVRSYSLLAIEQCQARVRGTFGGRNVQELEDGYRIADGHLEIPHTSLLSDKPIRVLEAFAVAQEHEIPLTRKALRLIRENLHCVDDDYRADPECIAVFLQILNSERRVMRSLMAMNEVGLLARFLPEWEHIVYRWQHVMYHTYTVDVHSIFLVEELRRLWCGHYEEEQPELTALMRAVDDRPVLFLGSLLHDIGKGLGGDHSKLGAERARRCVERLGLDAERVERVVFLVEFHLVMARLAQKRDLSDPKPIFEFARLVGDRARLRDLYLLTFADIRASSSKAWTDWKGQLLSELFERTSEVMESGSDDPSKALELIEKRVEQRRLIAAEDLAALGIAESEIEQFFGMMPHRYFIAHKPRQIARHAQVVLAVDPQSGFSTSVREMRGGFSEFILCTADRHALYANVAGTLAAHDINILGAHVYTSRSGLALEVYRVATPSGGEIAREQTWSDFNKSLAAMLSGKMEVDALLRRRGRPVGVTRSPARAPGSVAITNDDSDFYTIADITANDRLGLLHDLTRVIAEHGFEIYISKAATSLDQVTDTFYLKDHNGKKIADPNAIESLRADLREVVQRGGDGGSR